MTQLLKGQAIDLMHNCSQANAIEAHTWVVNIASGNGLAWWQ